MRATPVGRDGPAHSRPFGERRRINVDGAGGDVRYSFRSLTRDRRFSIVALLTIALGIGSATAVFSVIYNGLLAPFPYKDANRLITFRVHDIQTTSRNDRGAYTPSEFLAFRKLSGTFDGLVGFMPEDVTLKVGSRTLLAHASLVTPNTFAFSGIDPALGRAISEKDGSQNVSPVFAMNYRFWQSRFNKDPSILGKSFFVDGTLRLLVAIMPPRFQIDSTVAAVEGSDIWIPFNPPNAIADEVDSAQADQLWWPIARLKRGVSLQQASDALNSIAQALAESFPGSYPTKFRIVAKFLGDNDGNFEGMLYSLAAAVSILVLMTCANLINLLMARGVTRRREIAIRASLGATRLRLIRQSLTENAVLGFLGGLGGVLLAYFLLRGFSILLPLGVLPLESDLSLNRAVLIFASVTTILIVCLCACVAALQTLRGSLAVC